VERDPNRGALTFGDLCTGHIRHEHSLASHSVPPWRSGMSRVTVPETAAVITRRN